jgi:hypothetical protein
MNTRAEGPARSAGQLLKEWQHLGSPLRVSRLARSLDWASADRMIRAAGPVLRANSGLLKALLKRSNALLTPLEDPLLTDYGTREWLSHSREEAYSDSLALVLKQVTEPSQLLRMLQIDDPVAETALSGVRFDLAREVFTAEGHPGHTGRIDLQMVVRGTILIDVELKLTSADDSDVEKGEGYSASAKKYGVPKRHQHRRLLATDGGESSYSGGYQLVTWKHVAVQLRIVAGQMVKERRFLAALKVLGFVGAVEQNLLLFPRSVAESAFEGKSVPLSSGVIDHLGDSLNGEDYDAKGKRRVG